MSSVTKADLRVLEKAVKTGDRRLARWSKWHTKLAKVVQTIGSTLSSPGIENPRGQKKVAKLYSKLDKLVSINEQP